MPSFDYQAALKAGYTKDQIDQYLNSPQAQKDVNSFGAQPQTQVNTPSVSNAQLPTNIYEQIGQGAGNILGGIAKPFVETGRNILTSIVAPQSIGANVNAQVAANQNVPEFLRNIAGAESKFTQNAFKKLQDMGILTSEKDLQQANQDPTQFLKNQIANSAEIASYGIPMGEAALGAQGAKGLGGVALKYALPGAAVSATNAAAEQLRSNQFNPAELAGKTIVGAGASSLLGPAMDKILGAGKTTEKLGQAAEDLGSAVRSGQRKIHAPASIYGAEKEKAINSTLDRLGISGTPQQQYEQLLPKMESLGSQIETKLGSEAKDYSVKSIKDDFIKNVEHNLRTSDLEKTKVQDVVNRYIDDISNVSGVQLGDKTNTRDIFALKKFVNEDYQKIADKIDRGVALTPQEEIISQARKTLDDVISNLHPDIKDLTVQQSHLYDAAKALSPARFNPPTLRAGGFSIPSAVSQPVTDIAGRTLQGAGQKLQNLSAILPQGSNPVIQNVIGQMSARTPSVIGGNTQNQGQPIQDQGYGTYGQQQTNGNINQGTPPAPIVPQTQQSGMPTITPEILQAARLQLSKNDFDKLKDIYDLQQGDQGTTTGKLSAKDKGVVNSGLSAIKDVEDIYKKDPNILLKQLIPGQPVSRKFDAALFDAVDSMLRLRSGAAVPPAEVRNYMTRMAPTIGDRPSDVQYKIDKLRSDLNSYLGK